MARAFSPGLQCLSSTSIVRRRELPIKGETLVSVGELVKPDLIVARAYLDGDLYIYRISESLGIEPFEVIKSLKVKEGETVSEGTLICEHAGLWGLFKSRYLSRAEGTVEFIAEKTGHLGVRAAPIPLEIDAYISGKVINVEAGRAVEIESNVSFVQGIFGVGGERQGEIFVLDIAPDAEPEIYNLPESCEGKILFGGTHPSIEVLRSASDRGAVGFVVGSIDDRALAAYLGYDLGIALTGDEDLSMTLIVTEGFGRMPMAQRVLDVIQQKNGMPASVNGATQVRAGALRPEIIIPHQGSESGDIVKQAEFVLDIGAKIRVTRVPYFGQTGNITQMPPKPEKIETGAYTRVLYAKLDNGQEVRVPRANVELI